MKTVLVDFSNPGTYIVLLSVSHDCLSKTISDTIIIPPIPNPGLSDITACLTDSNYELQPPLPVIWDSPLVRSNRFLPKLAGVGDHELTFMFSDSSGCTYKHAIKATVHGSENLVQDDTLLLCNDQKSLNLNHYLSNRHSLNNLRWRGPSISESGIYDNSENSVEMNVVYVEWVNEAGCKSMDSIVIINIEPVNVSAGPDVTVCIDQKFHILTGYPEQGNWEETSKSAPSIDKCSGKITLQKSGTFVYRYKHGSTCSNFDEMKLTIIDHEQAIETSTVHLMESFQTQRLKIIPNAAKILERGILDLTYDKGWVLNNSQKSIGNHGITYAVIDSTVPCPLRKILNIVIHPIPEVSAVINQSGCVGTPMTFSASTLNTSMSKFGLIRVLWDFGQGSSSTRFESSHIYDNQGVYQTRLSIAYFSSDGHTKLYSNTITKEITISAPPTFEDLELMIRPDRGQPVSMSKEGVKKFSEYQDFEQDIVTIRSPGNQKVIQVRIKASNQCGTMDHTIMLNTADCRDCKKKGKSKKSKSKRPYVGKCPK